MQDDNGPEQQSVAQVKLSRFRLMESYLWAVIATAIAGRVLYFSTQASYDSSRILGQYYWDAVIAGLVFIFPIVFRLIFGVLPLEFLRLSRTRGEHPSVINIGGDYLGGPLPGATSTPLENKRPFVGETITPQSLLFDYATNSRDLAKGIYGRAGVYLLVGVLVAFSGLFFFYSQTGGLVVPPDVSTLLLVLAPKFGILFFIEFVAFFFLRQYRSAMDEFRYYEAVARTREEVVALLGIAKEAGAPLQPMELVKHEAFFSKGTVLAKGQTTEIIEARRMEKSEIDLLEKIVETLARAKK